MRLDYHERLLNRRYREPVLVAAAAQDPGVARVVDADRSGPRAERPARRLQLRVGDDGCDAVHA